MVDVGDDGDVAEVHVASSKVRQCLEHDLAGKNPGSTFHTVLETGILRTPHASKKEARPKGPGTPCSLHRNIIRNRQKTMGCCANLAAVDRFTVAIARFGSIWILQAGGL